MLLKHSVALTWQLTIVRGLEGNNLLKQAGPDIFLNLSLSLTADSKMQKYKFTACVGICLPACFLLLQFVCS